MDEIKITTRMLRGNRNSIIGRRNILEFNDSVRKFNSIQINKEKTLDVDSIKGNHKRTLKEPRLKSCLRGFY